MSARGHLAALRRADAEARALAQTDFERPLVLEAGAGTGKTATLVARVIAWAFGPGWERARLRVAQSGREASALRRAAAPLGAPMVGHDEDEQEDEESPRLREAVAADLLSRVVAITFTEAAAAEMAERVGKALEEIADGEQPVGLLAAALPSDVHERRGRALALLAQLDHFVVRTIHGFCRRVLAQWPLEAGLAPGFAVDADGSMLAQCVRDVVEAAVAEQYAASEATPLAELASAGHGPPEIEEALLQAAADGVPPDAFASDPFSPERLAAFWDGVQAAAEAFSSAGGEALRDVSTGRTVAALAAFDASSELGPPPGGDLPALGAWFASHRAHWVDANRGRLREWERGRFTKGESVALGEASEAFAPAAGALLPWVDALRAVDPARTEMLRAAFAPLLRSIEGEMERRGAVSYAGLLERTRRLLEANPTVARRARDGIDQLLVDEFQDTDATQCEIVRLLAGLGSGRPAQLGLFLVGDPKQSIYGWRGADLAAYERFVAELETAGGKRHSLRVNFRSVPAILDEVERVMRPGMQAEPGVQPAFEELVPSPARERDAGFASADAYAWAPVEHWISWAWDGAQDDASQASGNCAGGGGPRIATRSAEASELEARAVAEDLQGLRDRHGVAWSSIAILLRAMTQVEPLLEALRRRGIPYSVASERSFYRRREVADAALGLRCVLDPHDRIALVGWLRSLVVGVPDAALFGLLRAGLAEGASRLGSSADSDAETLATLSRAAERVRAELAAGEHTGPRAADAAELPDWTQSLLAGLEGLGVLRRSLRSDAPDVFNARFRLLFPYEALEAARYLGEHRAANLERFFREVRDQLVKERDPARVARWLRTRREEAAQSSAEASGVAEDAVRVLSIHGAKGLDFDHVYLLQTHRESRAAVGRATTLSIARRADAGPRAEGSEFDGSRFDGFEFDGLGARTLGFAAVAGQRAAMERAEHVRTLYVALTRARDRLVVAGAWPSRSAASPTHAELIALRGTPIPELCEAMTSVAARCGLGSAEKPSPGEAPAAAREAPPGRPATPLDGMQVVFPALWREAHEPDSAPDSARAAPKDGAAPGPGEGTAAGGEHVARAAGLAPPDAAEQQRLRARRLALRREATARMQRSIGGRVSSLAHAGEPEPEDAASRREHSAEADGGDATDPRWGGRQTARIRKHAGSELRREVARLAGTAIHGLLETLPLCADAQSLGRDLRAGMEGRLASMALAPPLGAAVRERCVELLDALESGPLLARLAASSDHVVARELPLLLPPPAHPPEGAAPEPGPSAELASAVRSASEGEGQGIAGASAARAGERDTREVGDAGQPIAARGAAAGADPLGFVAGAIDLVYRDSQSAEWVVVDFKTDRIATLAEANERAEGYRAQAEAYGEALRRGLDLASAPRLELWFLEAGKVVTLEPRDAP